MISGITSSSLSVYLQQSQTTQQKSNPPELFDALDSDGSDGVGQSELDTWASNMSSETGKTIDTSEAISTYDSDGNGELSSTELQSFLDANGIQKPAGGPPPQMEPPPETGSAAKSAESVFSTYDTDGDGVLSASELQAYLEDTATASSENDSNTIAQALSAYLTSAGQASGSGLSSFSGSLSLTIDFSG